MKIVLKFKTDNNFIPKDYHRFCIKFFKTAVSNYSNGEFFEKFFGDDYIKSDEKNIHGQLNFLNLNFFLTELKLEKIILRLLLKLQKKMLELSFSIRF